MDYCTTTFAHLGNREYSPKTVFRPIGLAAWRKRGHNMFCMHGIAAECRRTRGVNGAGREGSALLGGPAESAGADGACAFLPTGRWCGIESRARSPRLLEADTRSWMLRSWMRSVDAVAQCVPRPLFGPDSRRQFRSCALSCSS